MRLSTTSRSTLIAIVSLTFGCVAAFPEHRIAEVTEFPAAAGSKPSLKVTFEQDVRMNGELVMVDRDSRTKRFREMLIGALLDSGYFSEVGADIDSADLEVVASLSADFEINHAWMFATVLTGFLVPSVSDREIALETVVRTNDRASDRAQDRAQDRVQRWELDYRDSMRSWVQLFLIVMMPFHEENEVEGEIAENLFRRLALDIRNRGILAAIEPAQIP